MSDVTITMSYGDLLALRVYLERERVRQIKEGASTRAVERLIDRVEATLFPHAERDYTPQELAQIRRQSA